ncbi:hypothetical protein [Morganella morganii]|uniref:hypothetical protein n=1 Tax=Morganella morganii TaxID=582 RepID=UPI0021CE4316|nr:hypothetical protein [Morganella morganii]MCU6226336.1 hypothetical protein [Morganella morganii]MCU6233697.1 hypothetical protein [Morganella morganii]
MNSSLDAAFNFYSNHIYDEEKINLLREHGLKVAGHVPSVIWELFGSILTGRYGNGVTGADLQGWEVKSSTQGSSYEYQYHLNTGEAKLIEDCYVNHLFCSYSSDYRDVVVKAIPGYELKDEFFNVWLPEYRLNYDRSAASSVRRQRFRKSISYGFVQRCGRTVLEIRSGYLYSKDDNLLQELNQLVG